MRRLLLPLSLGASLFAACGSDPSTTAEPPSGAGASTDGASVPAPPEAAAPDASDAAPGPRVEVRGGELVIDGRPTVLYGGEVPYFRVRDKAFDATVQRVEEDDLFELDQRNGGTGAILPKGLAHPAFFPEPD